jgi:cysteinyl-tRNA synthetase
MFTMTVDTMQIIRDAREDLKKEVSNRMQAEKRVTELRMLLRTLVKFMPEESERGKVLKEIEWARRKAPSLVTAISDILRRRKDFMTSNEIRDSLEQSGFDLDEYSQPLGAIMTVLNRLKEQGHVQREKGKNRTLAFKWKFPAPAKDGS